MTGKAKILGLLTALVLVSALAGFLLGHRLARKQIEIQSDPVNWNEHVSQEFDRTVQPSPEQATKIQASLNAAVADLQEIRRQTMERSTSVIWRLIEEVESELTPEQQHSFEQMKPRPADLTLDVLQVTPPRGASNSGK